MFTGLVETIQPVKSNTATAGSLRLYIPLGRLAQDANPGDSICVNGVCLTISQLDNRSGTACFDVMTETVRISTLTGLRPGEMVNLERALSAVGRFGGHIVQGHVDGIGTIDRIERIRSQYVLWVAAPPELMRFMIEKGSVAIDGVSLTLVDVQDRRFSVSLIPTTLEETNLGRRKVGEKVNLEADLISKWIRKRLDQILPETGFTHDLTIKKLREQGFA